MLLVLVYETLKNNAHVMCDQRGGKKKVRKYVLLRSLLLEKRRRNFFLRETCLTSCFNPFLRKKEYDDDVCEQCEYHWTRRAHEAHEY